MPLVLRGCYNGPTLVDARCTSCTRERRGDQKCAKVETTTHMMQHLEWSQLQFLRAASAQNRSTMGSEKLRHCSTRHRGRSCYDTFPRSGKAASEALDAACWCGTDDGWQLRWLPRVLSSLMGMP